MYETEFQEYKVQKIQVRNQYWLNFLLNKNIEVEGPTFSNGRNILEGENIHDNNHMTELCEWTMNMWESDGRLGHMTTKSRDLSYERIGDNNH